MYLSAPMFLCPSKRILFQGLSLALKSHDQSKAFHWSTPPASQEAGVCLALKNCFAANLFGACKEEEKLSALLSASVERFFVSRIRDLKKNKKKQEKTLYVKKIILTLISFLKVIIKI